MMDGQEITVKNPEHVVEMRLQRIEEPVPAADGTIRIHPAARRLKALIRENLPGQCKIMSLGDECQCGLCDVERLQEVIDIYAQHIKAHEQQE